MHESSGRFAWILGEAPNKSKARKSGSQQTRRWRKGDSNPRSLSRSKTLLGHAFRRLWLRGSNPEGQVAAVGVMSLIVCDQKSGSRFAPSPPAHAPDAQGIFG